MSDEIVLIVKRKNPKKKEVIEIELNMLVSGNS